RITRNFADNRLTVIERGRDRRDVTDEYVGSDNNELGVRLTKLSRAEFSAQCIFVTPEQKSGKAAKEPTWLALRNALNSSSQCYAKAAAVNVLADCLNHFSYKSVKVKIDFLIDELERQQLELRKKAGALMQERKNMDPLLARLPVLQPQLDAETKH